MSVPVWRATTLGDICAVITDGAHASPPTVADGRPMASVKDLTRFGITIETCRHISDADFGRLVRQGCQPQIGDVLVAKDGATSLDTVTEWKQPDEVVLLSSIAILRPGSDVLPSFVRYYLDNPVERANLKARFRSGSAIPRVVLKDFKRVPLLLPPLSEQHAITEVLCTLDDKIELNERMNVTLDELAWALFKSWFVDFDPVRAKAEGREPSMMEAATAALFPGSFEDSALGPIPAGWRIGTLGDLVTVNGGSTPSTTNPLYWGGNALLGDT